MMDRQQQQQQQFIPNLSGDCLYYNRPVSEGFWRVKHGESIFEHSLLRLHAQLALFAALTSSLHFLLKRLCLPRFTSEILCGIIMGPTVLGKYFPNASNALFPPLPDQVLVSLAKLGYLLFTFLAGVRMDPGLVAKTGASTFIFGLVMFAIPTIMIESLQVKSPESSDLNSTVRGARKSFLMVYLSAITTSQFVGVSALLMHLKITNSRLGHFALASTLVCELARLTYSTVHGFTLLSEFALSQTVRDAIIAHVGFAVTMVVILRPLIFWSIRRTPVGKPVKEIYTTTALVTMLLLGAMGDAVGLHYLFGPFIFGLLVPAGSPLASHIIRKLDTLVAGLLIPLLSIFSATKLDLWDFFSNISTVLTLQISLIGYVIKLLVTFVLAICCNLPARDATALTLIVNVKGVLEIGILLSFGNLELRDIESTSGIFLVFVLASLVPPAVKYLYDPGKIYIGHCKKSIEHAPKDSELQILACAYRQEDAMAAVRLLDYCTPTKESPLSLYGLCLDKLVGRSTPIIINHQLGQRTRSSEGSRSQPIIDIFKYFRTQHEKLTQVHVFTAISPLKQMHEDICWLAFDKAVSLIILSFHEKWNSRGKMVSSSTVMRDLNVSVLSRAPCSVAIIIDRGTPGLSSMFSTSKVYNVAVLFIGGADDREALAFALRMAGSPRVQLTVIHLVRPHNNIHESWATMLDKESLRMLKQEATQRTNIQYTEATVKSGIDTVVLVRSIRESYDLIMVGRRHETEAEAISHLSEWVKFPELGTLGDLLASADFSKVSVLVVQQQIMKASHSSTLN